MSQQIQIAPGFGARLREERIRLGKSQSEFAEAADVRRLAQSQYEAETTSPTVRYLSAIAAIGADLRYLLFAERLESPRVAEEKLYRAELQAFKMLADIELIRSGVTMTWEEKYNIFGAIRGSLYGVTLTPPVAESNSENVVSLPKDRSFRKKD